MGVLALLLSGVPAIAAVTCPAHSRPGLVEPGEPAPGSPNATTRCLCEPGYFHGADFYRDEYKRAFSMLEQLEEKAVPLSRDDSSGFSAEVRRVLAYARDNRLE